MLCLGIAAVLFLCGPAFASDTTPTPVELTASSRASLVASLCAELRSDPLPVTLSGGSVVVSSAVDPAEVDARDIQSASLVVVVLLLAFVAATKAGGL